MFPLVVGCPSDRRRSSVFPTFNLKRTAAYQDTRTLLSDHPLHELWRRAREPQTTLFETHAVERGNTSKIELPSNFMVLKGGQWVQKLQPDSSFMDVLIRDEYKEALRAIVEWFLTGNKVTEDTMEVDDKKPAPFGKPFSTVPPGYVSKKEGFVLLGNPGIGKTAFLYVLLVMRLHARLPTIYQSLDSHLYYFDNKGVSQINLSGLVATDIKSQFHKSTWCLIDSNESLNTVPVFIQDLGLFIVQASSPRPYCFNWTKKAPRPVLHYFMKSWTPSELLVGRVLQNQVCSEKQIEHFSNLFGTSARSVYTHASNPSVYDATLLDNLAPLTYEELGRLVVRISGLDLSGPVSNQIVLISPGTSRDAFEFSFPTRYIYEKVRDRLSVTKLEAIALLYEVFVRVPKARSAAGPMLEDAVTDVFPRGGEWGLVSMERSPLTGPKYTHWKAPEGSTSAQYLHLGFGERHIAIDTDQNPVGTKYKKLPRQFLTGVTPLQLTDGYYFPSSPYQAAFDAFIYESASKTATVFRVITSSKYSVKEEGIEWLWGLGVNQFRYIAVSPPNKPLDLAFPNKWDALISEKYLLVVHSLPRHID